MKKLSFSFWIFLLIILVFFLIALFLVFGKLILPYLSSENVRVEKITEKHVYIEDFAGKTALKNFRNSVVTILPKDVFADTPLLPGAIQNICDFDKQKCDLFAVVLTSDGFAISTAIFDDKLLEKYIAFDRSGNIYNLRAKFRFDEYTVLKLQKVVGENFVPENPIGFLHLPPVNLVSGEKLGVTQKLMVLKKSLLDLDEVEDVMIKSIKRNDRFLIKLDVNMNAFNFEVNEQKINVGNLLFDYDGGLVAIAIGDNKFLTADRIEYLLERIMKKSDNPEIVDWGLNCVVLDKTVSDGLKAKRDYGCLVADGISADLKPVGDGVKKGGVAQKLGVRKGDLILEIDNRSFLDIKPFEIFATKVYGENVRITVLREDKKVYLEGVI